MSRLLVAAVVPLLLAGCSTAEPQSTPEPTATEINPCSGATPAPGCSTGTPSAGAVAYPDSAAALPAVTAAPFDGELARADNGADPAKRTATLRVVIPRGKVIASDLVCQGRGNVSIQTTPKSAADETINCDGNSVASQFGVFSSTVESADHTYLVTITADGPSRWLAAISARKPS